MSRKILMVTMSMDIGGAETHIMELSRELTRRGWQVVLASNGGVFVPEAEAFGIRHVKIPLHDRDPRNMLRSYRLLKQLIREEKPDLVHAHARIPAFITGLVRRSLEFPFVTTAHWVFEVTPVNRRLTDWGEYTIAVSEDIRQYLMDEYSLPSEQISVTINGIDTGTFSPETTPGGIMEEFGMDPDAPVLSYVSRMDESRAMAARQLIAIAPALAERIEGIQLLIAGGGDVFDELYEQAQAVNRNLGRQCIIMPGARTDIHRIVAAADVFVGVSRAALEAMSGGKPVIVAGNEGYIGPFTPDKLAVGQQTNFCCRGCELPQEELLLQNILHLFSLSEEERKAVGAYGRQVVMEHYSVKKMTDDYCAVYETAVQKRIHVLMSGYYGFYNSGDEAILSSTYANVRSLGGNISAEALIYKPERCAGLYEFAMVDRFRVLQVLRALKRCDILLFGGGSLLQDKTSAKSLWYYLAIIFAAEWMKKKVVLYSNGIGPVQSPLNRKMVRRAVNRADLITLRDAQSAHELERMGVTEKDLHVTADTVFTYRIDPENTATQEELFAAEGIPSGVPFAGVSVRSWQAASPDFPQRAAALCDYIYTKYHFNIVFVIMQNPEDKTVSRRIMDAMESPAYLLEKRYSTGELMRITEAAEFMLCMRLHTLIFAADMGVPSLGMIYDPKVRDYLELLSMPSLGDVEDLDVDRAKAKIDAFMQEYDLYVDTICRTRDRLQAAAEQNVELLREIFDECGK
ncbi:MAG: polysaccharide pyruvyl transferase CsaB [Firmicutes bacterium]|nr:polysaccharide pyruvyl transferase CsaB [Bacillota bacterium]